MNFDKLLNSISKIENIPLPAETSQFKMSPPFRLELIKSNKVSVKNAQKSAVLALFYPNERQETHLVLIQRKAYQGVHSAQISFPGGKADHQDGSLEQTALRETHEEVGVPSEDIQIIKQLTHVFIPVSNFFVQPFMGYTRETPQFMKQDDEVEAILEVRLRDLLNDELVVTQSVTTSYKMNVKVPAFNLNNHIVWGATAMMLSEIKDLLKATL